MTTLLATDVVLRPRSGRRVGLRCCAALSSTLLFVLLAAEAHAAPSDADLFIAEEATDSPVRLLPPIDGEQLECCREPGIFDELALLLSIDAFEAPPQFQLNGNFGVRAGFHWGLPLWDARGLGLQFGSSLGAINARNGTAVLIDDYVRIQSYTTLGLFRRAAVDCGERVSWGVAHDWFQEEYASLEYADIDYAISQWRGQIGYWLTACDQIGVWGAAPGQADAAEAASWLAGVVMPEREPFAQAVLFWEHVSATGMVGRMWAGKAEAPGSFVYGGDVFYPFHSHLALTMEINYALADTSPLVTPARENWSVAVGIAWNPCGYCGRGRYRPLLSLANAGTLLFREHF